MANYLPVLLISVNTNAIPDDNVLTTIPRGQVDYLSHDWQEEDVWRSWRNMTRQKNEITNGIRLENASWRTWWKQRNKLKTVTPETLNWLKDSDVTWLYGPLHTAVDWTPPPKPKPVPDSVDSVNPSSPHDRLDLHSASPAASRRLQPPRTKPILKHRSISELLTSDLPVSPIFSPQESEDETNRQPHLRSPTASEEDPSRPDSSTERKRPTLLHTKSDTHITRWGPSRIFRKDSPPRAGAYTHDNIPSRQSSSTVRASGTVRSSVSQDSASSTSGSSERTAKKKHISFNTFVEQCIAIEKPKSIRESRKNASKFGLNDDAGYDDEGPDHNDDEGDGDGELWTGEWDDDDGYEEDREDSLWDEDDPLWLAAHGGARPRRRHLNGSAIHSDSDSDDGVIEIRRSSHRHSNLPPPSVKKKPPPRSISVSSSSSVTTTTTTSASSSGTSRQRRKSGSATTRISPSHLLSHLSATSAYRPRPVHATSSDSQHRDHVTIAPIAPTLLKTTGAWEEGFGDEGGPSDDGLWEFGVSTHGVDRGSGSRSHGNTKRGKSVGEREAEGDFEGTPVELVYVPPFGSVYGHGVGGYWHSRGWGEGRDEGEIEEIEEVDAQVTSLSQDQDQELTPREISPAKKHLQQEFSSTANSPPSSITDTISQTTSNRSPIPVVVIEPGVDSLHPGADKTNVSPQDSREEVTSRLVGSAPVPVPTGGARQRERDEERARGRSASISPIGAGGVKMPSPAASGNGGLLSTRGRTQSCQDLQSFYNSTPATTFSQQGADERRSRPNTRTSSSSAGGSTSNSWRGLNAGRNSQSSFGGRGGESGSASPNNACTGASPIGSPSPDGNDNRLGGIGGAYASGRMGGRERERVSSSSSISGKATGGNEERRGRDRGRRVIGSGSGSSSSPIAAAAVPYDEASDRGRSGKKANGRFSPSSQEVVEPDSLADASGLKGKGKELTVQRQQQHDANIDVTSDTRFGTVDMDASICSISSEGSTATIVPTRSDMASTPAIFVPEWSPLLGGAALGPDDINRQRELQLEQEAIEEAEHWRKTIPTPSNSPQFSMSMPGVANSVEAESTTGTHATPQFTTPAQTFRHSRSASASSPTSSQSPPHQQSTPPSKLKSKTSPPIIPSPPHPALPSTSSSHAPGEVGPFVILATDIDGLGDRSASRSLERASSRSRERGSPISTAFHVNSGLRREFSVDMERERESAEARRGRNARVDTSVGMEADVNEPTSPTMGGMIIDKAVGMVSSAGAYLRLWPNSDGA